MWVLNVLLSFLPFLFLNMKKKTLFNIKGAGRPAMHDRGIRHIARDVIKKNTALHLTVKIEREKAGLRNKDILKALQSAIFRARLKGLRILHYTLEYDHVHLLVEADNNQMLATGMQSFGICFSKGINRIKRLVGRVFQTRYHFRKLKSRNEIRNAFNYIVGNSIKHKKAISILSPYNSLVRISNFENLYPGFELGIETNITKSDLLTRLRKDLEELLPDPNGFLLNSILS